MRNLNTGDSIKPRVCQLGVRTSIRTVIFSDITESLVSLVKFWLQTVTNVLDPIFNVSGFDVTASVDLGNTNTLSRKRDLYPISKGPS